MTSLDSHVSPCHRASDARATLRSRCILADILRATSCVLLAIPACAFSETGEPFGDPSPSYVHLREPASSDEIYDPENLPRFDLALDERSLDRLREWPREEVPATFKYRDIVLPRVGVRLKGEYSFRTIDEKPSFRIDFDELTKGQTFLGLAHMILNNTVQDPTFLSERFAYHLYRSAGLPAPRANSALLYVNGAYYGVYTNVEAIDETFLARWFGDPSGNLYEDAGIDLTPGADSSFDLEINEKRNDRRDLAALIAALDRATPDNFVDVVSAHVDMNRFVRYAALEAALGQQDGYAFGSGEPNNFRMYGEPTGEVGRATFVFIPCGMDRTLRPTPTPALIHEWVPSTPVYASAWDATGLLLKKCLLSVACRADYSSALLAIAPLFESSELHSAIQNALAQIRTAVIADARKELDNRYFDYASSLLMEYVAGRAPALRADVARGRPLN